MPGGHLPRPASCNQPPFLATGEVGDRCCRGSGSSLLLVKWEIAAAGEVPTTLLNN